jgi:flagellar biosynthesis protein FliR
LEKEPKASDSMGVIAKAHKDFFDAFVKAGFNQVQALSLTMNLITSMMNKATPQSTTETAFWNALKKNGIGLS